MLNAMFSALVTFCSLQDQVYIDDDVPSILSQLMLPITATVMLMTFVNILNGNDKKYPWNWKPIRRPKRVQAAADYSKKYVLITGNGLAGCVCCNVHQMGVRLIELWFGFS